MVTSLIAQYDSSTVKSAAYNYEHKTLLVHFSHGSYLYKNVSNKDFEAFHNAESQGRSLNEIIKPNYEFEKVNEIIEPAGGKL